MSKLSANEIMPIINDIRKQRKHKTREELSNTFFDFFDRYRILFDIVSNINETSEERNMVEFLIGQLSKLDADKSKEFDISVEVSSKLADKYLYETGLFQKPTTAALEEHIKKLRHEHEEIKANPDKVKDISWKEA